MWGILFSVLILTMLTFLVKFGYRDMFIHTEIAEFNQMMFSYKRRHRSGIVMILTADMCLYRW